MAFDIRCPECDKKLRLDAKPAPDDPIECPECGARFTRFAAEAEDRDDDEEDDEKDDAPKKKKGKKGKKKKEKADGPKKAVAALEGQERTFMNPYLLLGIILGVLGSYLVIGNVLLASLGKAGRVADLAAFLPKDVSVARGANLQTLNRYPGYKDELEKYVPPLVKQGLDAMEQAAGLAEGDFQDYMMSGQIPELPGGVVYVFRAKEEVDRAALVAGLKAADAAGAIRCPAGAPGFLSNAVLMTPNSRVVVVAPAGPGQQRMAAGANAAIGDPDNQSLKPLLGDTGMLVIRGHGWMLIRAVGAMSVYPKQLGDALDKDLPAFQKAAAASKMLGAWNSFGASVRYGGAMDCGTEEDAEKLMKALKESPFGKGDDGEVPRQFKYLFSAAHNKKEFGELKDSLSFRTSGTAAYFVGKVSGENAKTMLSMASLNNYGKYVPKW